MKGEGSCPFPLILFLFFVLVILWQANAHNDIFKNPLQMMMEEEED
jgi:hypothetical protein